MKKITYRKALDIFKTAQITEEEKEQIKSLLERLRYYGLIHNRQDKLIQAEIIEEKLKLIR